jgi:hypothetical protein
VWDSDLNKVIGDSNIDLLRLIQPLRDPSRVLAEENAPLEFCLMLTDSYSSAGLQQIIEES